MEAITVCLLVLAITGGAARAWAGDAKCFPNCRSGFVCSPQGQCVSACNPACSSDQTCSEVGECIDRPAREAAPNREASRAKEPAARSAPEKNDVAATAAAKSDQEPLHPFEVTLGLGGQKVLGGSGDEWGVTPEAAFLYTLNAGRPAELFLGFRARINTSAVAPGFGPEFGVRGGLASSTGFVRGGFFIGAGPEVVLGNLTRNRFQGAVGLRAAAGPFFDVGPLVARIPIAFEGIYVVDKSSSSNGAGLLTISVELGIRF